jgi:hypothetical protein
MITCLSIAAGGTAAVAYTTVPDGISDQSMPQWDSGFPSSYFAGFFRSNWAVAGHIQYARYTVQWNVMNGSGEPYVNYRAQFKAWVEDAGGMGLTLDISLTSFNHVFPGTQAEYKARLKEILNEMIALGHPARYLEAWNEPNHQGSRTAQAAAEYGNQGYVACEEASSRCTIIAGNLEDSPGVKAYEETYRANLHPVPTIWGVHPYWSVEHENASYYEEFRKGLPNEGSGDQIWFTEVAARYCTQTGNNGEIGQANRAKWLVNTLMVNHHAEHVFYYEFLFKEHRLTPCEEYDDALYVPSSDPSAPDAPRPAARYIFNGTDQPWAYTGGPSVTNGEQATITGSVYPGGFLDTRYHFEYGPTTSYGSYTTEGDAGSGTGGTQVSASLSSLQEGTTYHYRLVAWNSSGAAYGPEGTFTTPRRPSVVTESPTGIGQTEATVHGSANPNGSDTHAYFEYGTTTSYGSTVPAPPGWDIGAGTSFIPTYTTLAGLEPGTTYHYRIVASNLAGTSKGSDQTFTELVGLSPAVIRDPATGDMWVFYQGANRQMWVWNATTTGWHNEQLTGETFAPGASPTVVRDPATGGDIWVYYQGSNHQMWVWNATTTGWHNEQLTGEAVAPGTSPIVERSETTGEQWLYYQGANGQMWVWNATTTGWHNEQLTGETFAAGASPTVERDPSSGDMWVFYQGTSTQMWNWYVMNDGTGWHNAQLTGEGFL